MFRSNNCPLFEPNEKLEECEQCSNCVQQDKSYNMTQEAR